MKQIIASPELFVILELEFGARRVVLVYSA
jgi:hypothetical protein